MKAKIQRQKSQQIPVRRKMVIVGDGDTGKTSMLFVATKGYCPAAHIPTILETEVLQVKPLSKHGEPMSAIELTVWDTAGQEDYDRLRPLAYPKTDVFLVCFSVNNHNSYLNISEKWMPELRHFSPKTPIILVATKTDLREDGKTHKEMAERQESPITSIDGHSMAQKVQACLYMECSAFDEESIDTVFQSAATLALNKNSVSRRHQPCTLL